MYTFFKICASQIEISNWKNGSLQPIERKKHSSQIINCQRCISIISILQSTMELQTSRKGSQMINYQRYISIINILQCTMDQQTSRKVPKVFVNKFSRKKEEEMNNFLLCIQEYANQEH